MSLSFPFAKKPAGTDPVQIEPGILWFRFPLPMALDHVNVYALADSKGWTIVDTGFHSSKGVELWKQIMADHLAGRPIKRVIVSHYHPDHVGMAGWFKHQFGAEIYATRVSWLFARMLTLDVQEAPTPEALRHVKVSGINDIRFEEIKNSRPFNFADCVYPIPLGYKRLSEGDWIKMGHRNWQVRIGHGHAPSHATFWSEDGNICIGADQFLPDITSNIGVYASEPEANPLQEWLDSCRKFLPMANEDILVLPGHKSPFRKLETRLGELIEHHESCLENLSNHLIGPSTAVDCFDAIFGRRIPDREFGLALAETNAHLNYLWLNNQVAKEQVDGVNYWRRTT